MAAGKFRRVLGFVASLYTSGAGHFALGRWRRGIGWFAAVHTLALLALVLGAIRPLLVLVGSMGVIAVHLAALVDFVRLSPSTPGVPSWKKVLGGWAALLVINCTWGLTVRPYYREHYVSAYTIPSGGMAPALLVGDYILTDSAAYRSSGPRRGDIVVFKYPLDENRTFIKRVIGLPGEEVRIKGPAVHVGGRPLDEPYSSSGASGGEYGPATVPPDSYFVLGDNRDNSMDSRHWGFVKREKIRGKASIIYWSWDGEQSWPRFSRVGRRLD